MTKRKKSARSANAPDAVAPAELDPGSITTQSAAPIEPPAEDAVAEAPAAAEAPAVAEALPVEDVTPIYAATDEETRPASSKSARRTKPSERTLVSAREDIEATVNVTGDLLPFPGRDDLDAPTVTVASEALGDVDSLVIQRKHLRGLLEALIFASDSPIKSNELAKLASAQVKLVKELLAELRAESAGRGVNLEEVAGGWVFRTNAQYAPFIRDLTKQRPVRLSRAQVETLAIISYRQPITRPEVDDVRGVDSGPVLKVLLERDLVRILGKRDEPGRPLIYGTTTHFLEFFGLKSLKDLPTLREFTELTDESREKYEEEIGEPPNDAPPPPRESFEVDAGATDEHPHGDMLTDPDGHEHADEDAAPETSVGSSPEASAEEDPALPEPESDPAHDHEA